MLTNSAAEPVNSAGDSEYFTAKGYQSVSSIKVCSTAPLGGENDTVIDVKANAADESSAQKSNIVFAAVTTSKFSNNTVMTSTPNAANSDVNSLGPMKNAETPASVEAVSHILIPNILVTTATPDGHKADGPEVVYRARRSGSESGSLDLDQGEIIRSLSFATEETLNFTTKSLRDRVDDAEGLTISFEDITLDVEIGRTLMDSVRSCRYATSNNVTPELQEKRKRILHKVSGFYTPGLHAIMGPSGSGKSTFLEVVSGRKERNAFSGKVLINGMLITDSFKKFSGFATQDDVLNPNLTVREHLHFSLLLRRHGSVSKAERAALLEELVHDLKLTRCQHMKVGDWSSRSISGGERKRTAIGMELASAPKVLYLDEPTSKLDSSTSKMIVNLLKKQATNGRTVIMTIHQPSYSIYKLFDKLTLLAKGQTIYHGSAGQALNYFANLGYKRERHYSPPDFFLDLLFGCVSPSDRPATLRDISRDNRIETSLRRSAIHRNLNNNSLRSACSPANSDAAVTSSADIDCVNVKAFQTGYSSEFDITTEEGAKEHAEIVSRLSKFYLASSLYETNKAVLATIAEKGKNGILANFEPSESNFLLEWMVLTQRAFKCSTKVIMMLGIMNLVVGLLFGTLYYHPDHQQPPSVQNRLGLFFYMSVHAMMFPAMTAAKSFAINEKELVAHERRSRHYRAGSYCLARCLIVFVTRSVSAVTFSSVVYWMAGLRPDVEAFISFLWTALSTGLACDALCLLVAVVCASFSSGIDILVLYLILASLFAGFLLDIESTFPWLQWIKYISITRFCYLSWVLNEFHGQAQVSCPRLTNPERARHVIEVMRNFSRAATPVIPNVNLSDCAYAQSDFVLPQTVGDDYFLMQHPWMNSSILLVMAIVLFVCSYLRMRST